MTRQLMSSPSSFGRLKRSAELRRFFPAHSSNHCFNCGSNNVNELECDPLSHPTHSLMLHTLALGEAPYLTFYKFLDIFTPSHLSFFISLFKAQHSREYSSFTLIISSLQHKFRSCSLFIYITYDVF